MEEGDDMIQVDEESRISFYDGNQGPKQCRAMIDGAEPDKGSVVLNCVLPLGHDGIHESHNGDTVWRVIEKTDVFFRRR